MKVGNGVDPSDGELIPVLDGELFSMIEVLSVGLVVWIVVESNRLYGDLYALRIVLTVYNMTGRFISKQYL